MVDFDLQRLHTYYNQALLMIKQLVISTHIDISATSEAFLMKAADGG